jgi:anti-sigma regulatory factor (Ser/Thr protein kinase)
MENTTEELAATLKRTDAFLDTLDLPTQIGYKAKLILEEVLTNILKYAYSDEEIHRVCVELIAGESALTLEFVDDGHPFDPLAVPPPRLNKSILECSEGGLGIHLVRQTADTVEYRREGDKNIVTVTVRSDAV